MVSRAYTKARRLPDAGKLTCPVCKHRTHYITLAHIRSHGFSNSKDFRQAFGLRFTQSDALISKRDVHVGRHPSALSLQKMRDGRQGKGLGVAGKYNRTTAIREKISVGVTKAHEEGRLRGIGHGAYISSPKVANGVTWVRSSWERRLLAVFDRHPQVEWVEVEPFSIPYVFDNTLHSYWPDFLVHLIGGLKEVWEVKADYLSAHPTTFLKTAAKHSALNAYARAHQINACWVHGQELLGMEMQVGITPWMGVGAPWVDLLNPNVVPPVGYLLSEYEVHDDY